MTGLISVITPTLNEEESVERCYAALREVFSEMLSDYDFEHIFTDNASTDGTAKILRKMAAANHQVKVILNSRNFGAEASMLNALRYARGDAVLVMLAADLQDPPELIPEFVRHWEDGFKVVYGIRRRREENLLLAVTRKVFYRMVRRIADFHIPPDVGEFQLVDRVVVDVLKDFDDRRPYLRGMIASCGFRSIGVEYDVRKRRFGRSNMGLYRLLDQGLNGLLSYSSLPLRMCMTAGFLISMVSIFYATVAFVVSLIHYRELAPPGIPTLIVALFFFGGVQLFFLGVLGEYILAIHTQVRRRPLVIEAERLNIDEGEEDHDSTSDGARYG